MHKEKLHSGDKESSLEDRRSFRHMSHKKGSGAVAHGEELLPGMHKAPGSIPSTT